MITLKAINLHWITTVDLDLCAHGQVIFKIREKIVSDESSGDWTVSAAAYNLLKTLGGNHDGNELAQLIPCCGFTF